MIRAARGLAIPLDWHSDTRAPVGSSASYQPGIPGSLVGYVPTRLFLMRNLFRRQKSKPTGKLQRKNRLRAVGFESLEPRRLLAGAPELLMGPNPFARQHFSSTGYLSHYEPATGFELWKTDGTAAGTFLVKDINPNGDSNPTDFFQIDGTVYFRATDFVHGEELWKTDGTEEGTVLVKDIEPGPNSFFPSDPFDRVGNNLVFRSRRFDRNQSYWVSDGTESGTFPLTNVARLRQISPTLMLEGVTYATPYPLCPAEAPPPGSETSGSIFSASSKFELVTVGDVHFLIGQSVWRLECDGSLVTRIGFGTDVSNVIPFDGELYFVSRELGLGREWWRTDGTVEGTELVEDIAPGFAGSLSPEMTAFEFDGDLYFAADDGVHGEELWKIDSATGDAMLVKDIRPGAEGSHIFHRITVHDALYFAATDGVHGEELWRSDGTEQGTQLFRDITPGSDSTFFYRFIPPDSRGVFYFVADVDAQLGEIDDRRLWRSDGTVAGTFQISPPGIVLWVFPMFGDLVFSNIGDNDVLTYWRTDGSIAGTKQITHPRDSRYETEMVAHSPGIAIEGLLYTPFVTSRFSANEEHLVVYRSDGTPHGTFPLRVFSDEQYANFSFFTEFQGQLLVVFRNELWLSDGTVEGTRLVGTFSNFIRSLRVSSAGEIFLLAGQGFETPVELWKTNGDPSGSTLIREFPPNESGVRLQDEMGGHIYFDMNDGLHGIELWKTDGTPAGTQLVRDIKEGHSEPQIVASTITALGPTIFFKAINEEQRWSLWRTDGTSAGTTVVKHFTNDSIYFDEAMIFRGELYFTASDPEHGKELWKTDGTVQGTGLVIDLFQGPNGSEARSVAVNGDFLYFVAYEPGHGTELYKTDGTAANTTLVKDITPGPAGSFSTSFGHPNDAIVLNGKLYVTTRDSSGSELWATDGTQEGTYRISSRDELLFDPTLAGNYLYFTGYHDKILHIFRTDGTIDGTERLFPAFNRNTVHAGGSDFLIGDGSIRQIPAMTTEVAIQENGGTIMIQSEEGRLTVRHNSRVLLSAPAYELGTLRILGSAARETIFIDLPHGTDVPAGGIEFVKSGDSAVQDTLVLATRTAERVRYSFVTDTDGHLEVDGHLVRFEGIDTFIDNIDSEDRRFTFANTADLIDLRDDGDSLNQHSRITFGSRQAIDFQHPRSRLEIDAAGGSDRVAIGKLEPGLAAAIDVRRVQFNANADALLLSPDWRPAFQDEIFGESFVIACQGNSSLEVPSGVELEGLPSVDTLDWHNAANPFDVDNSGEITTLDALRLINELNRPAYHDPENGGLLNPPEFCLTDRSYFDVNDDGFLTSLDVLLIVNRLNS